LRRYEKACAAVEKQRCTGANAPSEPDFAKFEEKLFFPLLPLAFYFLLDYRVIA
jgi:hypothetical protein